MHVLRDADSINAAITSCADPHMKQLIADRAEFVREEIDASKGEYDDVGELIKFILVEPGDTLQMIDAEMDGTFLADPYGGKSFGDPAFVPPFETMDHGGTPDVLRHRVHPERRRVRRPGAGPQAPRHRPLAPEAVRRARDPCR